MKEKKGPFTGPFVIQAPKPPLEDCLKKFEGRRTPRTFKAAQRLQKPGIIRVPKGLLNKLWELTGGWKQLKSSGHEFNFPARRAAEHRLGRCIADEPDRPWRNRAYGLNIGDLEVVFIKKDYPECLLRWRGWLVGHIDDMAYERNSSSTNWLNRKQIYDVIATMCHLLSAEEADEWGFFRAGDLTEKQKREKEEEARRNRR